jgi:hypothetical protein
MGYPQMLTNTDIRAVKPHTKPHKLSTAVGYTLSLSPSSLSAALFPS